MCQKRIEIIKQTAMNKFTIKNWMFIKKSNKHMNVFEQMFINEWNCTNEWQ